MTEPATDGFLYLDFKEIFPGQFWISDWTADRVQPAGFRYKLLTSWRLSTLELEGVLILELRDGGKRELKRFTGMADTVGLARLRKYLQQLESQLQVHFEELDFSSVQTAEEFQTRISQPGWRPEST